MPKLDITDEQIIELVQNLSPPKKEELLNILLTEYQFKKKQQFSDFNLTAQLEAMANDPSIKAEIKQIEQEFQITELDGLGN